MEDIPREILNEILLLLDKSSLFRASNVCKLWRQLASMRVVNINTRIHLREAAKNGDQLSIIKSSYNEDWIDWGLFGACEGGHKDLVNLMISKDAYDFDYALMYACRGGHKDLMVLLIIRGINNFDYGLFGACEGGHKDLIKLMIAYGARNCCCDRSIDDH
jgi:hypothetical protein